MPTNPSPERKIALCYSRKSDIQGAIDFVSIVWQDEIVEQECAARGWIPEWYRDTQRHNSGRRESNRAAWSSLRKRISAPDVVAVIVATQDRASRSVRDTAALIEDCRKHKVQFVAPADGTDTTRTGWDAQTVFILNVRASLAQGESDFASQRLRHRIKQYRGRGIPWGAPPFGMARVGNGLSATLKPDADAPAALAALEHFASGLSYDQAALALGRDGHQFRDRNNRQRPFTKQSVRTIVSNVLLYLGYLITAEGWAEKSTKIRLSGEGTYLAQYMSACGAARSPAIEPLITTELASSVIERRITSKYFKVSSSKWLPLLTPIVWSAEKRLRGESRPRKNLYVARGGGAYIDAEIAEQNLINKLSDIQFPQQMRDEIKRQIIAQTSDERRAALKKQYDDLGDERTRLLQLFLKKQVQLADYDTEYKRIEQALAAIQSELDKPSDVERVLGQLGDLASTIKLMSREAQRRTIHRLFDRIELDENGEVIGGNVKPWLFLALNEVAVAILAHTPAMGSVGNNPATGVSKFPPSTVWLATLRPRF